MRLLFDGYWWERGPGANRTVQRELIAAWSRCHPGDEIVVALRRGAEAGDLPQRASVVRTVLWPHAVSNRWELPRLARRARADAIVCHNYTPARGESIVFVHDVMFEEHPEWFSRAERLYFRPMLPWARRASAIATSTRTEAARILRSAPGLPAPVVTGLGVPAALTGLRRRPERIGEGAAFAVTVGRLNVRKNLETIMLAAARSERISPATPMCIVGGDAHSGVGSRVPAAARALLEDGSIVMLGALADEELAWLYANTALAVALSLDEGFGMPAVEAASFGAPLLASDIPVFRETVGGYATFVDPLDVRAVAGAIDEAWGARPSPAARDRILSAYRWDAAALAMRDTLARAISAGPAPAPR